MSYVLGIDLGTSSVKVLLTTETGQIISRGSAAYPIYRPYPTWAEQHPEDWWQAAASAVRQALGAVQDASRSVAAIGLSGQMHGSVLLDKAIRLPNPAVIWPAQPSQDQVREITNLVGAERLIKLAGSPVTPVFKRRLCAGFSRSDPTYGSDLQP